jgi:hypothetical protein
MRRRDVLRLAAAAGLVPRRALGFGEASRVDVCELDVGSGSLTRPNAWSRLLYETEQTTSVECEPRSVRLAPDDPVLFQHPFAVLPGDGGFAELSTAALEQLERYLGYGGLLVVDDATGAEHGPFDDAVRKLVERLFPTRPLVPLPPDHSIYRIFFLLKKPLGRVDRFGWLEGVTFGSTTPWTPIVYMRNDLSGALDRTDDGRPAEPCVPGGETQRREAVKLGINLIVYALTANYKRDQAHVKQLMKEGRLE